MTKEYIAGLGAGIIMLMAIIEGLPGKLKPWSWLFSLLGKKINADITKKVDSLSSQISEAKNDIASLKDAINENEIKSARMRILRFGDEAYCGVMHSKEHFDQILKDVTRYEQYCNDHPDFQNNVTVLTIKRIKDIYKECMNKQNFL